MVLESMLWTINPTPKVKRASEKLVIQIFAWSLCFSIVLNWHSFQSHLKAKMEQKCRKQIVDNNRVESPITKIPWVSEHPNSSKFDLLINSAHLIHVGWYLTSKQMVLKTCGWDLKTFHSNMRFLCSSAGFKSPVGYVKIFACSFASLYLAMGCHWEFHHREFPPPFFICWKAIMHVHLCLLL